MPEFTSLYLDLVRCMAAAAVFLYHAAALGYSIRPHAFTLHGEEAVCIFFVLSGFVIAHVTDSKENDWRSYTVARLARILPVAVLALLVTSLADKIGILHNPQLYVHAKFYNADGGVGSWLLALSFGNELWFQHSVVGTNEPFWSLGFEVPYYLGYGIAIFVPGRLRWVVLAGWAVVVGPKIALYFPLWMMGKLTYRLLHHNWMRPTLPRLLGSSLLVFSAVNYAILKIAHDTLAPAAMFNWTSLESSIGSAAYYYGVAICFGASLLGTFHIFGRSVPVERIGAPVRWLADGSFTLYLIHLPLLTAAKAIWPSTAAHPGGSLLIMCGVSLICYGLASLVERRKAMFRDLFRKLPLLGLPAALTQLAPEAQRI